MTRNRAIIEAVPYVTIAILIITTFAFALYIAMIDLRYGDPLVIVNNPVCTRDFDRAPAIHPTLYIHSDTDPDNTSDTWIPIYQDHIVYWVLLEPCHDDIIYRVLREPCHSDVF